ncbi:MAG: hypothetical protein NTY61_02570, partial [Candidatus Parcubacteria bacterium]|nr:hypothetical protein [Candidatus Parcubacteria bacterium]
MEERTSKGGASIFALIVSLIIYGVMIVSQYSTPLNNPPKNNNSTPPATNNQAQKQTQTSEQTPPVAAQQVKFSDLIVNGSANAKINPGSKVGYNILMVSMDSAMILGGWKGEGISANLVGPSGVTIDLTKNLVTKASPNTNPLFSKQGGSYILGYEFPKPIPDGTWNLIITNSGTAVIDFGVTVAG